MKPNLRPHRTRPAGAVAEPTEEEVQHGAYFLWEEPGRPSDRELDIWLAARERLRHRPGRRPHRRI